MRWSKPPIPATAGGLAGRRKEGWRRRPCSSTVDAWPGALPESARHRRRQPARRPGPDPLRTPFDLRTRSWRWRQPTARSRQWSRTDDRQRRVCWHPARRSGPVLAPAIDAGQRATLLQPPQARRSATTCAQSTIVTTEAENFYEEATASPLLRSEEHTSELQS